MTFHEQALLRQVAAQQAEIERLQMALWPFSRGYARGNDLRDVLEKSSLNGMAQISIAIDAACSTTCWNDWKFAYEVLSVERESEKDDG